MLLVCRQRHMRAVAPLASSVHPPSQHIARLRKPELLLRMLLIRNSGFTEAINQAKQNNGTRNASSSLCT